MSRLTIALIALLLTNSCGLLFEPSLPSMAEVAEAKKSQAKEWQILSECYFELADNFDEGQRIVAVIVADNPQYPRLALLLQDYELMHSKPSVMVRKYLELDTKQPSALSALLVARVQSNRDLRIEFAQLALERDPHFAIAKVFELGMRAEGGEADVFNSLVILLDDNPGCAEGWRLLAQLAPLYAHDDYVIAAALTEPWVFDTESVLYADSKEIADKVAAVKLLEVGEIETVLLRLSNVNDPTFVRLTKAVAFARQNKPLESLLLITEVLSSEPDNPVAIFNRALLYRDYFGYTADDVAALKQYRAHPQYADLLPQDIRLAEVNDLNRFLELTKNNAQDYIFRRTQAEYRLARSKNSSD